MIKLSKENTFNIDSSNKSIYYTTFKKYNFEQNIAIYNSLLQLYMISKAQSRILYHKVIQ